MWSTYFTCNKTLTPAHPQLHNLTLVMHQEPSGPGVALEKSTIPEKSGSSGSWMGVKGRSGSGPGPAREEERERAVRTSPVWNKKNGETGGSSVESTDSILLHRAHSIIEYYRIALK